MGKSDRLQLRVSKSLLAKVTVSFTEFYAYVQDLNKGGIGMVCNRDMVVGEEVKVSVNVPQRKNVMVEGNVVWRRELPSVSKHRYQYGVKIETKPEEYEEYIEELIKKQYERRRHPRFKAVLEVKNEDVMDLLDAATEDVSAAGLYIRTGRPLPVGGQFQMALSDEDFDQPIYCIGEVVTSFECDSDSMDQPYGAGVKIISFVGDDGERFTDYIRQLENLYEFHWPENLKPE